MAEEDKGFLALAIASMLEQWQGRWAPPTGLDQIIFLPEATERTKSPASASFDRNHKGGGVPKRPAAFGRACETQTS